MVRCDTISLPLFWSPCVSPSFCSRRAVYLSLSFSVSVFIFSLSPFLSLCLSCLRDGHFFAQMHDQVPVFANEQPREQPCQFIGSPEWSKFVTEPERGTPVNPSASTEKHKRCAPGRASFTEQCLLPAWEAIYTSLAVSNPSPKPQDGDNTDSALADMMAALTLAGDEFEPLRVAAAYRLGHLLTTSPALASEAVGKLQPASRISALVIEVAGAVAFPAVLVSSALSDSLILHTCCTLLGGRWTACPRPASAAPGR